MSQTTRHPVPGSATPSGRAPHYTGLRMRTVVAGLIALAISVSVLLDRLTSIDIPAQTLALGVLIIAGVLLLGSGIAAAVREQRAQAQAQDPFSTP